MTINGPRRYGEWGGRPNGVAEDPTRCIKEIFSERRGAIPYQCQYKRGHGKDGLWCKRHDPDVEKAKAAASKAAYEAQWALRDLERDITAQSKVVANCARVFCADRCSGLGALEEALKKLAKLQADYARLKNSV